MASLPAFLGNGQRLVQRAVGVLQTFRVDQRISEKPEIVGQGERGAGAPIGVETLYQPRERRLGMSSQQQRRGFVDNPGRVEQRKPLIRREAYLLSARRKGIRRQAKILIEPACVMQRIGEAERMLDRARELKHLAVHLERLFGKTEVPQGQGEIAAMRHTGM